jgi:hypothetical protein
VKTVLAVFLAELSDQVVVSRENRVLIYNGVSLSEDLGDKGFVFRKRCDDL